MYIYKWIYIYALAGHCAFNVTLLPVQKYAVNTLCSKLGMAASIRIKGVCFMSAQGESWLPIDHIPYMISIAKLFHFSCNFVHV